MPAYTQADLVVDALQRLGEIGDGQTPSPEAVRKVGSALPGILADLQGRGVYAEPAFEEIDAAAFGHLGAIVASEVSDKFGLPQTDIVTLASRAQAAEGRLRTLRARPATRGSQPICFY